MEALDGVLAKAVERGDAPGLIAMVADRSGLLYAGVFGQRSADAMLRLDDILWIASQTKLVTSVAALQLVERGLLGLDTPIARVLPDFASPLVLERFDTAGTPQFRSAKCEITLRHLLTHTSGFGYEAMNADLARACGRDSARSATSRASLKMPLLFDPGSSWEYGVSTDWVGLAIEAVTGRTLEQYFDEHIFDPLRMPDTSFSIPGNKTERIAALHLRAPDGRFAPIPSPVADRSAWDFYSAGAGLLSTAGDTMRFLRMLLAGGVLDGVRVLRQESVSELTRNQIWDLRAGAVKTAMPALYHPFDLFPGMQTQWSLGGLINPVPVAGGRHAGTLAWLGLANTHYWIDRDAGLCAVLMAQFLPFADPAMTALLHRFEAAVYAHFAASRCTERQAAKQLHT